MSMRTSCSWLPVTSCAGAARSSRPRTPTTAATVTVACRSRSGQALPYRLPRSPALLAFGVAETVQSSRGLVARSGVTFARMHSADDVVDRASLMSFPGRRGLPGHDRGRFGGLRPPAETPGQQRLADRRLRLGEHAMAVDIHQGAAQVAARK